MTLTFIFHSCFVLETNRCILVFDYWMDPSHSIGRFIYSGQRKPVYVFASHFHEDHFTKDIFAWRKEAKPCSITYILSKDIFKRRRAHKEDAYVWLSKDGKWEDENISVIATGSNDSGVSWIVSVDGKTIFHAGDLCNWFARFLNEGASADHVYDEETGNLIDAVAEEKRFLGELKDIRKNVAAFDLVMFPVDGRIGNGYTLGARQFIEQFRVQLLVPMHFTMSGFESAWRMAPFCRDKQVNFWEISREGELLYLDDIWK